MAQVKAKVTHIQPGTLFYREEGEEFEHDGKPYKHVEVVKAPAKGRAKPEEAETSPEEE